MDDRKEINVNWSISDVEIIHLDRTAGRIGRLGVFWVRRFRRS